MVALDVDLIDQSDGNRTAGFDAAATTADARMPVSVSTADFDIVSSLKCAVV